MSTSPVAIKILNEDSLQGHKEWLVGENSAVPYSAL